MAFTTIKDATVNGLRIRLVDQAISSFALVFQDDGNLAAIAYRTTDPIKAGILWRRSVDLAQRGFSHPAWKVKPRKIEIAS